LVDFRGIAARSNTMGLNKDQVKEILDTERALSAVEKANAAKAEREASDAKAFYEFQLVHTGAKAVQAGIEMWCCQANFKLLADWCERNNELPLSLYSLNLAFDAERDNLAPVPLSERPTRHTNLAESRIAPQPVSSIKSIPKPDVDLGLTKADIVKLVNGKDGPAKLRKLMGHSKEREEYINRVLAGK
jgi:hypothetical protein